MVWKVIDHLFNLLTIYVLIHVVCFFWYEFLAGCIFQGAQPFHLSYQLVDWSCSVFCHYSFNVQRIDDNHSFTVCVVCCMCWMHRNGQVHNPCMPVKRSEQDIGCLSLIAFGLIILRQGLHWLQSFPCQWGWLVIELSGPACLCPLMLGYKLIQPCFPDCHMHAGNSNSGPHTCRTIYSVPDLNIFYWSLIFTTTSKISKSCQNSNFIFSMPDAYAHSPLGSSSTSFTGRKGEEAETLSLN